MTLPKQITPKIVLCALLVVGSVYLFVDATMISPWSTLESDLRIAQANRDKIKKETSRLEAMHERWRAVEARTFPERTAQNNVDALMKRLLQQAQLDRLIVKPASPTKLARTPVSRMTCSVAGEGSLANVVKFMRSLYTEPFLNRITRVHIAPLDRAGGGSDMKMELQLETLVFPETPATASASQPLDRMKGLAPLQRIAFAPEEYDRIVERNIFAAHEDPPKAFVRVQNEDRLPIDVIVDSFWQDAKVDTQSIRVPGKQRKEMPVMTGNRLVASAKYEDAKPYAPARPFEVRQRFDPTTHRFELRVPSHTPPPPPPPASDVQVVITNADDKPVEVSVEMMLDGQSLQLAPVTVRPRVPVHMPKKTTTKLTLAANYDGGGTFGPREFTPDKSEQRFEIPPKPITPKNDAPIPHVEIVDAAADVSLKVTGLWTYPEGGELIATDTAKRKRKIFELYDKVDSGKLVYIHPLGGIVQMPSGHYYLYPLGKGFAERALLTAKREEELPEAVAAWSSE